MRASANGHKDIAIALAERGADLNIKNKVSDCQLCVYEDGVYDDDDGDGGIASTLTIAIYVYVYGHVWMNRHVYMYVCMYESVCINHVCICM